MLSPLPLVLQRLSLSDEAAFNELVSLYEDAFPEEERKSTAALRKMLANPNCHFLLASESGLTTGFAIVCKLQESDAALLEYMAVVPTQRGRGLGRQMVIAIQQTVPQTLLLEVESDRIESPDRATRTRRKNFYRSLGAREIDGLRWLMPPVAITPPPPMELMIFSTGTTISRDHLRQWLTRIYVEVYQQSATDPRIDTMLSGLPGDVPFV